MEEGRKAYLRKEFEKFYKENYSRFYYYALTLVPDDEVCKDLVDDSFHYLWERIESFQWNTGVTYMYTHVHHLCIDYLRRAKMEEKHRESFLDIVREWNDHEHLESERRIRIIMQIIEEMEEPTCTILTECYLKKKKYREVATMVGLSESGVCKHIMKGLNKIRSFFYVKYKKGGN